MDAKGKKILIADDEPDILEVLQYNLVREGYEVTTAKDGDDALLKAKSTHPDLIILDIMMPKKSGVEVCEILRTQAVFHDTLILMLTALSTTSDKIEATSPLAAALVIFSRAGRLWTARSQSLSGFKKRSIKPMSASSAARARKLMMWPPATARQPIAN